jgi:hypothetical protein
MATYFAEFQTSPTNLAADLRTQVLNSTDWSRPNSGTYPNLVKATTTDGAQMCVQFDDAAATSSQAQFGVYRTHDGTTGVDKQTRYMRYYRGTGNTAMNLYVTLSAGKEHLYISIEGPRPGDTYTENAAFGGYRHAFCLAAITPYHGGDTVDSVALIGSTATGSSALRMANNLKGVAVSRNQGDTSSWVTAQLLSLTQVDYMLDWGGQYQPLAKGDGNRYLFPYVVVENQDGIRGRLKSIFYGGLNFSLGYTGGFSQGEVVNYSSADYKLVAPYKTDGGSNDRSGGAFGTADNYGTLTFDRSPLVAVPYA